MNANVAADWRADLDASRDLSDLEKQGFGFLLSWFESYRMRKGLRADRPAAVLFWREQVVVKPRKQWQLDRWAEAVRERLKIVKSAQSGSSSLSFISSRLRAFACDHQTVAELLKGIRNWCITRRREGIPVCLALAQVEVVC